MEIAQQPFVVDLNCGQQKLLRPSDFHCAPILSAHFCCLFLFSLLLNNFEMLISFPLSMPVAFQMRNWWMQSSLF